MTNSGTVYKLARPATAGGAWIFKPLHVFDNTGDAVGAGLTFHNNGRLYGTYLNGDLVFELVPPVVAGGSWTENTIHTFGSASDGHRPMGKVVFDPAGNLYGTTEVGGADNFGTVFELTPPASEGGVWTETILYSFSGGKDGFGLTSAAV